MMTRILLFGILFFHSLSLWAQNTLDEKKIAPQMLHLAKNNASVQQIRLKVLDLTHFEEWLQKNYPSSKYWLKMMPSKVFWCKIFKVSTSPNSALVHGLIL
jgi:hypothetical protein